MRFRILVLTCLISFCAAGQALQDINYNYLYNPSAKVSLSIAPVRLSDRWLVLYKLDLKDGADEENRYSIQWEGRDALNDKQGTSLQNDSLTVITSNREGSMIWGQISFSKATAPKILVGKVVDNLAKQAWFFYKHILPEYPVNGYLLNSEGQPVFESFIPKGSAYTIRGTTPTETTRIVSYYTDDFPAAAPAFSEGQARVPSVIKVDSTFLLSGELKSSYDSVGLYLVQSDTTSREGFAFRVYEDYPKYTRLESLSDPLIYVCTKQESERLKEARGDKKSFDRVILSITGNTDRAKSFMRNYFRRVELANQYFSSYKEGWKTDRGMIYIIFGLPDELYKFTDREVWTYKNDLYKVTFDFVRSPTLFDPDNYVLIRNKKFQDTWYQVIDLWRNARF